MNLDDRYGSIECGYAVPDSKSQARPVLHQEMIVFKTRRIVFKNNRMKISASIEIIFNELIQASYGPSKQRNSAHGIDIAGGQLNTPGMC